jgi:hypothetical protein
MSSRKKILHLCVCKAAVDPPQNQTHKNTYAATTETTTTTATTTLNFFFFFFFFFFC